MERPNTVSGLIDKRRELIARLEQARAEIKTLISGLDALDIALRLFGAEGAVTKPMRLPPAGAVKANDSAVAVGYEQVRR